RRGSDSSLESHQKTASARSSDRVVALPLEVWEALALRHDGGRAPHMHTWPGLSSVLYLVRRDGPWLPEPGPAPAMTHAACAERCRPTARWGSRRAADSRGGPMAPGIGRAVTQRALCGVIAPAAMRVTPLLRRTPDGPAATLCSARRAG